MFSLRRQQMDGIFFSHDFSKNVVLKLEIISHELSTPQCNRAKHWHRQRALLWDFQVGAPLFSIEAVDASLLGGLTVSKNVISFLHCLLMAYCLFYLIFTFRNSQKQVGLMMSDQYGHFFLGRTELLLPSLVSTQ